MTDPLQPNKAEAKAAIERYAEERIYDELRATLYSDNKKGHLWKRLAELKAQLQKTGQEADMQDTEEAQSE